jgi:hypothetical protein
VTYNFSSFPERLHLPQSLPPHQLLSKLSGGWGFNKQPPGWERATLTAFGFMGLAAAAGFAVSSERERRPVPPLWHIASQSWSAHAKEDDPSLR